jgi:CheY-like chemotaxis protein
MADTGQRVLIVDDDVCLLDSLSQILTGSGWKVKTADGAVAALAEIRKEMPDVLLCDLNMPGFSGFELLSAIRRRFPTIHVIAMSAAFVGDRVPPGVAADAFYAKGRGVNALIEIIAAMGRPAAVRSDLAS